MPLSIIMLALLLKLNSGRDCTDVVILTSQSHTNLTIKNSQLKVRHVGWCSCRSDHEVQIIVFRMDFYSFC